MRPSWMSRVPFEHISTAWSSLLARYIWTVTFAVFSVFLLMRSLTDRWMSLVGRQVGPVAFYIVSTLRVYALHLC